MAKYYLPIYIISCCFNPPVERYSGCSYYKATVNDAAMNMGIQIAVWENDFISFDYISRSGIMDHITVLFKISWGISTVFFFLFFFFWPFIFLFFNLFFFFLICSEFCHTLKWNGLPWELHHYASLPTVHKHSFFSTSSTRFVISYIIGTSHSNMEEVISLVLLICISFDY